jgi:hypothetical protein
VYITVRDKPLGKYPSFAGHENSKNKLICSDFPENKQR